MATRSHIGKRNLDGTVDYIYCHWDGYPSYNGVILKDHYTTMDKVNELIELGDLSSLNKNIGSKHDWSNPPEDECNAYGRDRGEKRAGARNKLFQDLLNDDNVDYVYVFDGDYWECYRTGDGELINLYEEYNSEMA